jgi:hypothetical protein
MGESTLVLRVRVEGERQGEGGPPHSSLSFLPSTVLGPD